MVGDCTCERANSVHRRRDERPIHDVGALRSLRRQRRVGYKWLARYEAAAGAVSRIEAERQITVRIASIAISLRLSMTSDESIRSGSTQAAQSSLRSKSSSDAVAGTEHDSRSISAKRFSVEAPTSPATSTSGSGCTDNQISKRSQDRRLQGRVSRGARPLLPSDDDRRPARSLPAHMSRFAVNSDSDSQARIRACLPRVRSTYGDSDRHWTDLLPMSPAPQSARDDGVKR